MLLYLVRHAHADSAAEDALRPLSPQGRLAVRRLALGLRAANVCRPPAAVWHSPLRRARETAELLVAGLGHGQTPVLTVEGLLPEDDPTRLVPRLWQSAGALAIVGHEPFLGSLASYLVTGREMPAVFAMEKGTVLCLERPEENRSSARWRCHWQVVPEMFPPVV